MALAAVKGDYRRGKAALFVFLSCFVGAIPHWIESPKNLLPAIALAFLLGGYALTIILLEKDNSFDHKVSLSDDFDESELPMVDVLVAARDEENVVEQLIERLAAIRYPKNKISFWIVDDGSEDNTFHLLQALTLKFSNFYLLKRARSAGGGKSGALNYALQHITGDWLFILDADAQLQEDVLLRLLEFAKKDKFEAVQLRKAVINSNQNLLTCCQSMEMAMDAIIQRGRLQVGGVVELRGNGQLIQRRILDKCGGFNEETVTDDLDLSFRLLLLGAFVGILWNPPVQEEAVQTLPQLIKQRQRWAEGGLQRFFDYGPLLISNTLDLKKKQDLACFFLLQYAIPVVSFSDLITSSFTQTIPTYWPLSFLALSVSGLAFWRGCRRKSEGPFLPYPRPIRLIFAIIYLMHWFLIIPLVAFKMAILPKKLVWAKTIHQGH
tara:strand:- start:701 stop:2011 length:1311 start_codon:yes stop_codon:yes gene_type:complete